MISPMAQRMTKEGLGFSLEAVGLEVVAGIEKEGKSFMEEGSAVYNDD